MPAAELWLRLRHSQDHGSGRPDEVVAAIAERIGGAATVAPDEELAGGPAASPNSGKGGELEARVDPVGRAVRRPAIEIAQPVRERLWLAGELEDGDPASGAAIAPLERD